MFFKLHIIMLFCSYMFLHMTCGSHIHSPTHYLIALTNLPILWGRIDFTYCLDTKAAGRQKEMKPYRHTTKHLKSKFSSSSSRMVVRMKVKL